VLCPIGGGLWETLVRTRVSRRKRLRFIVIAGPKRNGERKTDRRSFKLYIMILSCASIFIYIYMFKRKAKNARFISYRRQVIDIYFTSTHFGAERVCLASDRGGGCSCRDFSVFFKGIFRGVHMMKNRRTSFYRRMRACSRNMRLYFPWIFSFALFFGRRFVLTDLILTAPDSPSTRWDEGYLNGPFPPSE